MGIFVPLVFESLVFNVITKMNPHMKCCCCEKQMHPGLSTWHYVCRGCGYECSIFEPSINNLAPHSLVDENARENGLKSLRVANFSKFADRIRAHVKSPEASHLLEIGSAHGWFLEIAEKYFHATTGIEPDNAVCKRMLEKGFNVVEGYFPEALPKDSAFEIIVFNDVLEHIPNINSALDACRDHLSTNGILAVNLPSSEGFFYKLSKLLFKIGLNSSFERMWQKGLPSPHLHYFNGDNLTGLIQKHQFELLEKGELRSLRAKGLYDRIAHVKKNSKIRALIIWLGVLPTSLIISLFKSDISFVIYAKANR